MNSEVAGGPAKAGRLAGIFWLGVLVLAALSACGVGGAAVPGSPERPRLMAELPDGRHLAFRCSGRGAPTVLLESGFGADSRAWSKVQPALSRLTRVCAYDRAGYGFSDPGPPPRSGAVIAEDLDAALQALRIEGPFVLVGHSAGGLYARLLAARRLHEVEGLVVLDGTVEQLAPPGQDGLDGIRRRVQRCLAAAENATGDEAAPAGCQLAVSASPAESVQRWRDQLSELDAIFGDTSLHVMRMGPLLQDIPAYVITASQTAASAPQILSPEPRSLWELQHQVLASSFRIGFQRTVLSSHLVMVDRPDVVIQAATAMVEAARAGKPPPPLPPSETDLPSPDAPSLDPGRLLSPGAERFFYHLRELGGL